MVEIVLLALNLILTLTVLVLVLRGSNNPAVGHAPPRLEHTTAPADSDPSREPKDAAFLREREAFHRLKPDLMRTHKGKYVAVHGGEVICLGDSSVEVVKEACAKVGCVPVYIGLVAEGPRVLRVSSPRWKGSRSAVEL